MGHIFRRCYTLVTVRPCQNVLPSRLVGMPGRFAYRDPVSRAGPVHYSLSPEDSIMRRTLLAAAVLGGLGVAGLVAWLATPTTAQQPRPGNGSQKAAAAQLPI